MLCCACLAIAMHVDLASGPRRHHHPKTEPMVLIQKPVDPRFFGTWWVDVNTIQVSGSDAGATIREEMKDEVAFASITFKADGTFLAVSPNSRDSGGTWKGGADTIRALETRDSKNVAEFRLAPDGWSVRMRFGEGKTQVQVSLVKM